jgi:hypothetical protein
MTRQPLPPDRYVAPRGYKHKYTLAMDLITEAYYEYGVQHGKPPRRVVCAYEPWKALREYAETWKSKRLYGFTYSGGALFYYDARVYWDSKAEELIRCDDQT